MSINIGKDSKDSIIVDGNGNNINITKTGDPPPNKAALRLRYLKELATETDHLPWASLDPDYANPKSGEVIGLSDIYIALDTTELEKPKSEDEVRHYLSKQAEAKRISAQEMLDTKSKLVLLGDPGSGKSTMVNFLAYLMAQAGQDDSPQKWLDRLKTTGSWKHGVLLPVRIILREFAAGITKDCRCDCHEPLLAYIEKSIRSLPGLSEFWTDLYDGLLNSQMPYLILLDGLDEVPTDLRESVVKIIDCFARKYSRHRYLVTCRIYAYIGQNYQLHGFHQATLTPFSKEQIENFVSAWYRELAVRGRFTEKDAEERAKKLKYAATRPDLSGLAERPLLMTVMALLHTFRGELPDDRVELYQWTTDLLLRRWQGRSGGEKGIVEILNIPQLKMNDLEAGLYDVAFHAHAAGSREDTADIAEGMLRERLAEYLGGDWNKAGIFVEYVRERAGLLIRHKPKTYTFPHRTFQEFMAACHLTANEDYPAEASKLVREYPNLWRIVFVLSAGHAARTHRRPGQAIAAVNALCPVSVNEADSKDAAEFRLAEIAGEALIEIGLLGVRRDRVGKAVLQRITNWLLAAIEADTILEPKERVSAGNVLSVLGDPRFDPANWYLPKDDNFGFVEIPAGSFMMGSDKERDKDAYNNEFPQHKVTLSAYSIGRYPVTVAQFKAFMEDSKYRVYYYTAWEKYNRVNNHPVRVVSWHDVNAYCEWLTEKLKDRRWKIRLPTEAEWEYAARGTDGRIFPWGDDPIELNKANYGGWDNIGIQTTNPVGCYPSGNSSNGLSDMAGNVWEWCQDWYGKYTADAVTDPILLNTDSSRVLRGGGWYYEPRSCRTANRGRNTPDYHVGFRLVRCV